MKKKLFATAILGTATGASLMIGGVAQAQTGVTLYGNIDGSLVTASNIGPGSDRRNSFGEGNWASSIWGIRGTEDLGSGMRAHFRLEGGFSSADGGIANGGTTGIFGRMANLGLSGNFGSLTAGLNLSPFIAAYTSTLGLAGNNFYRPALLLHREGTVVNSAGLTVPATTGGADADVARGTTGGLFIPNSITYSLPSELLRGATASVMYAFGGVPGNNGANRFISGNVGYAFGNLNVVAAASNRDAQYKQYLLGARVPVGPVNLAANVVRFDPEAGRKSHTFVVGAELKVLPNSSVGVNYARNNRSGNPSIINLSAAYSLSKTMDMYAAVNRATDGAFSSYSGMVDGLNDPVALGSSGTSTAVIVGLRKGF